MARDKKLLTNIDNSNLADYPNGRIKNQTGLGDGTPVNEIVYGDYHETFAKLMRLYGFAYNGLPDNETNTYQLVEAMKALASKNDYTLPLNTAGGFLTVPLKISFLKNNETFLLKATVDKTSETEIKGTLDNVTKVIDFVGNFKAGEYVRMINTPANITLIREVDFVNLNTAVGEYNYLKAATIGEVIAGLINTKAVTPESFLNAFLEYVNGATSDDFLATSLVNGLYPKAHFNIVENLGASPIKNKGWFSGLDINGTTGSLPVSGNIVSAVASVLGANAFGAGSAKIVVTMQNAMDNVNYIPKMYVQSQSANISSDLRTCVPVFKIISTTVFEVGLGETQGIVDNLKIHIQAEQL